MTRTRLDPLPHHRLSALLRGPGWRRALLLRRGAAAVLVGLALVLALVPPPGSAEVPVVVAAADLAGGSTVQAADLAVRRWPSQLAPGGAVRDVAAAQGRVLVGAARAGEPLTDVRLLGSEALARAGPDAAAVPVRLADAGVAALLVPGARVDVVTARGAADAAGGPPPDTAQLLAAGAAVLTVLPEEPGQRGRLVLVALPREAAARVAAAALNDQVAVTLR